MRKSKSPYPRHLVQCNMCVFTKKCPNNIMYWAGKPVAYPQSPFWGFCSREHAGIVDSNKLNLFK